MPPSELNGPVSPTRIQWAMYSLLLEIVKLLPEILKIVGSPKQDDIIGPVEVSFERLREVMKPRRTSDY